MLGKDVGKNKIKSRGRGWATRVGRGSPLHCYHMRDNGQPISWDPERCGQGWDSTARTRGTERRFGLRLQKAESSFRGIGLPESALRGLERFHCFQFSSPFWALRKVALCSRRWPAAHDTPAPPPFGPPVPAAAACRHGRPRPRRRFVGGELPPPAPHGRPPCSR